MKDNRECNATDSPFACHQVHGTSASSIDGSVPLHDWLDSPKVSTLIGTGHHLD